MQERQCQLARHRPRRLGHAGNGPSHSTGRAGRSARAAGEIDRLERRIADIAAGRRERRTALVHGAWDVLLRELPSVTHSEHIQVPVALGRDLLWQNPAGVGVDEIEVARQRIDGGLVGLGLRSER